LPFGPFLDLIGLPFSSHTVPWIQPPGWSDWLLVSRGHTRRVLLSVLTIDWQTRQGEILHVRTQAKALSTGR
jgi:hypothetical protein